MYRALFGLLLLAGCASHPPFVWYSSLPREQLLPLPTSINPGDKIIVNVADHPEASGEFLVGAEGDYNHPVAGLIKVAGSNSDKAASIIEVKLSRFIQDPKVRVTLLSFRPISVTVFGEVGTKGTFEVPNGSGLMTALGRAGGLGDFADEDEIYILRATPAAQRIRFRYSDLTKPDPVAVTFKLRDGDVVLVE